MGGGGGGGRLPPDKKSNKKIGKAKKERRKGEKRGKKRGEFPHNVNISAPKRKFFPKTSKIFQKVSPNRKNFPIVPQKTLFFSTKRSNFTNLFPLASIAQLYYTENSGNTFGFAAPISLPSPTPWPSGRKAGYAPVLKKKLRPQRCDEKKKTLLSFDHRKKQKRQQKVLNKKKLCPITQSYGLYSPHTGATAE